MKSRPQVLDICAGTGGAALGFEMAGYDHAALVEIDSKACATLRRNRPHWNVIEKDLRELSGDEFRGVDVIVGGLPSLPFSVAGEQQGIEDARDLFPAALRLVKAVRPRVVVIDNVKGLLGARFDCYRTQLLAQLTRLGHDIRRKMRAPRLILEIPTHNTNNAPAMRHRRLMTGHRLAVTSMANDECPLGRL